jgi:ubiquitin-conjugating enzyme E2 M
MSELSLPSNCSMNFPEGKDKLMHFEITIRPEEGYYRWVKQACRSWQQVAAA